MKKGRDRIEFNVRRRSRASDLPEHSVYRDDGCSVSARCQDCPLPMCRNEHPGGLRGALNLYRNERIVDLLRIGIPVEDVAATFGISQRQTWRVRAAWVDSQAKGAA